MMIGVGDLGVGDLGVGDLGFGDLGFGIWELGIAYRQLRPDDRLQPRLLCGFMKSWRAVDAIRDEQRERGIAERRGTLNERFGQRRALKKAESGSGVELDVHGSIDHALNEPLFTGPLAKQAIRDAVGQRDIPLIAIPPTFALRATVGKSAASPGQALPTTTRTCAMGQRQRQRDRR